MIDQLIENVSRVVNDHFLSYEEVTRKSTKRAPNIVIIVGKSNNYILEYYRTSEQMFYAKRKVRFQNIFQQKHTQFFYSEIVLNGLKEHQPFILFRKDSLKNLSSEQSRFVKKFLSETHKQDELVSISAKVVEKTLNDLLLSWPSKYHEVIKLKPLWKKYEQEIANRKELLFSLEHGDFTFNNVVNNGEGIQLNDFEFSRSFQVAGFDYYDFLKSMHSRTSEVLYSELHEIKYRLIEEINRDIDSDEIQILILKNLHDFENIFLRHRQVNKDLEYLLEWLKCYDLAFKEQLYLVLYLENNEIKVFLPFIIRGKRLYLAGSREDVFDAAPIYCTNYVSFEKVVGVLRSKGLTLTFRHYAGLWDDNGLFRCLVSDKLSYHIKMHDIMPEIVSLQNFDFTNKISSDYQRLRSRLVKDLIEIEVDYNYTPVKDDFNIFLKYYFQKWGNVNFVANNKFKNFLEQIFFSRSSRVSILKFNGDIVAMHLSILSPGVITSYVPVYDTNYESYSPGKLLLYDVINSAREEGFSRFSFGRGPEPYKFWYSNNNIPLMEITIFPKRSLRKSIKVIRDLVQ